MLQHSLTSKRKRLKLSTLWLVCLCLNLAVAACGEASPTAQPTSIPKAVRTTATVAATTVNVTTAVAMKIEPPAVINLAEAKKYSGVKLNFYGDAVGDGTEQDQGLAAKFQADTGIIINVIPKPDSATETYAAYQRMFQSQSPDVDVLVLDVIWPGAFANNLVDLKPKLGDTTKLHFESIIENNTVNDKLVAMPWFGDFGILYYRSDLLQKYGFAKPPETWDELQTMALKIQAGEKTGNPNFAGFVFQGQAYEGLTCNALEWLASSGGGQIVENGKSTINNPAAIKALNRARSWIGTIAPSGVTAYKEEDGRNLFDAGNAAFMRNWPYAYAISNNPDTSKVVGKFDVAPLPHDPGQKSVGTVGGWQLGVSKYSKNQDAAIEFVRYVTSAEAQKWHALIGSYVPTIKTVAADPDVIKVEPFLAKLQDVVRVARPSRSTGVNYNEVSTIFFQAVNQVWQGKDATQVLPDLDKQVQALLH